MVNKIIKFLKQNERLSLFIIIAVSLIINLFVAFNFEGTGDSGGWSLGSRTAFENTNLGMGNGTVYDGDCWAQCTNWPPLTYHYLISMRWVYLNLNPFNLAEWGFYKLLPVIASTSIALVLYIFAKTNNIKKPLLIASLYALHPISLYIAGYHGQRDTIWVLSILITILLFSKKHFLWAAAIYGAGIAFKVPSLMFLPLFILYIPKKSDKLAFALIVVLTFFVLNIPEIYTHTEQVVKQVFLYSGWTGWWGLSGIFTKITSLLSLEGLLPVILSIHKLILLLSIVVVSFYFAYKKTNLLVAVLGVVLTFFVFSTSFAAQYLVWPLPFLILFFNKYSVIFWRYSLFALLFAINFYGIYQIAIFEKIFVILPQQAIFYKIANFSYPMDLSFPLWVFSVYIFYKYLIKGGLSFK